MQRGKWIFVTIIIGFCSQMICGQEFEMMWDDIVRTYVVLYYP